ncbi:hypothetical protein CALCODRAFT_503508 [Calocera cornea HHB12733]|uniref:Uncharacterized protein n=1 Tax=Calocera cornea HHB12733 TaxID=1353952 RepID=A0A165CUZ0_9BASI|nr:hypothetical protein CALCODRAFT_503508 [Calocera cornea HHB12733]
MNSTGNTNTAGHGTGLMGKIKNALDPNVDSSTGATTTTGTAGTHHHHTGRDAALAGGGVGILEHERNKHQGTGAGTHQHHVGRDAALAGGGVGLFEHHRNHHDEKVAERASAGATGGAGHGNTTSGGFGHSATGAGTGTMGMNAGTSNVAPSTGHAGRTEMKGKFEAGLGKITHNQSMINKGIANQEQANAERYQSGQINEAERLEQAAQARRGNAVNSGAHPSHGTLGGTL